MRWRRSGRVVVAGRLQQMSRHPPPRAEHCCWASRCFSSAPLQEAIRQLQLCTAVDSEEMQRLGVKMELDEATGKLRVTKAAAAPLPHRPADSCLKRYTDDS